MFPTIGDFIGKGSAITADSITLTGTVHPILARKSECFNVASKTRQWISAHSADLFVDVEMVSIAEFAHFQHQAAVQRLPLQHQSPANSFCQNTLTTTFKK